MQQIQPIGLSGFLDHYQYIQEMPVTPDGDGRVDMRNLLLAMRILKGQYTPSQEEQERWDVAALLGGVPEPDQKNNLGDYLILRRKILGVIIF